LAQRRESEICTKPGTQMDRMGCSILSGAEMVELLAAAKFSQAWFKSAPNKGAGWPCALVRR
jgi:hypothetical protein